MHISAQDLEMQETESSVQSNYNMINIYISDDICDVVRYIFISVSER